MSMFGSLRYMAMMSGFSGGGNAGSGGGAPSDWNAKEGEPGYILNKPFGDNTPITVFPEETIPFNENFDSWVTSNPVAIPPDGTVCTVTINGSQYESTLRIFTSDGISAPILGTPALLGGEDTGEPFFIMMAPPGLSEIFGNMTMQIVILDGSADDITISIEVVSVKKIAYEFMPDGYPRIETSSGVILPETAIVKTGLMHGTSEALKGDIIVGKTYTVNISGTEYQTEAKRVYFAEQNVTLTCLGNPGIFELGSDTGEPFIAWVVTPEIADLYENASIVIAGGAISGMGHTISITGEIEVVHEMDSRFIKLPMLYYGSDNNSVTTVFYDSAFTKPVDSASGVDILLKRPVICMETDNEGNATFVTLSTIKYYSGGKSIKARIAGGDDWGATENTMVSIYFSDSIPD